MSLDHPKAFASSGFFLLRTPLLPLEELLAFAEPGLKNHRSEARATLRQWAERLEVHEALWIASPELVQSLGTLWEQPESAKGRRLEQALYRYLARMTARATPFGAFAGCSTGTVGNATRLELGPRGGYRLHSRLDIETLGHLVTAWSADPGLRSRLPFRVNDTLHRVADRYHHVQLGRNEGLQAVHLISTEATPAVEATLSRASKGATAGALAEALIAGDPEITREDADAFLGQLIDSQVLLSELPPPITGTAPILSLAGRLERAQSPGLAAELRALFGDLEALDQQPLGARLPAYDGIARRVTGLGGDFKPGRLVQVDLSKPTEGLTLDARLTADILDAVRALHAIQPAGDPSPFRAFKQQFHDRYGDREVPILEALDDESGIGFEQEDNPTAEPLLAGIEFRAKQDAQAEAEVVPPALARRLEALRSISGGALELDAQLVAELKAENPLPMPDTWAVLGSVFQAPELGAGFQLRNAFGPSGANLLTRFCHEEQLTGQVQAHVQAEEALEPDSVFAEIIHLPEGRAGNVVCRPILRRYELPLLTTSGVPSDRQIPLSDLTLSIRGDRIILRSRRLGATVIPRLTSAHNFAGTHTWKLYKFLCLLQHQDTCADLHWDWRGAWNAPYLPRVVHGRIVLSPARWRIDADTSLDLAQGRIPVSEWRQRQGVPRLAFIAEGDQYLLIDFENPLAEETFLEMVRRETETVLVEMIHGPEGLITRGPEGHFVHEVILPFIRTTSGEAGIERNARPTESLPSRAPAIARIPPPGLGPGPSWLFAKLYCSPSHADVALEELIRPLIEEVGGAVTGWFFMRYADPDWHVRLRFKGDGEILNAIVLPALFRRAGPLLAERVVWRMAFDSYEPEVERYGGPHGIHVAERLFQFDSEYGLEVVPLTLSEEGAELRWKLAFSGADHLMSGLGLNLEEKRSLVERLRTMREQTWWADGTYRQQVAHAFRSLGGRTALSPLLRPANPEGLERLQESLPETALGSLQRLATQAESLRGAWEAGELTSPFPEIATSLVHMHFNRVLRACHLEQEAIICDFLGRVYTAELARGERA